MLYFINKLYKKFMTFEHMYFDEMMELDFKKEASDDL